MRTPDITTTTAMSPSELAKCRENLIRQWEDRKIDEDLLQRAWEAAHHIATVLYEEYGASKVAVFGSLAEREWFHKDSDIDIAVWGILDEHNLKTICKSINMNNKHYRFDLIDYERVKKYFRNRVKQQAIHIKKGVTYSKKMLDEIYSTTSRNNKDNYMKYTNRLIQLIEDKRHLINCLVSRIISTMRKIKDNLIVINGDINTSLADDVAMIYQDIVKIFIWIILYVDCDKFPDDEYSNDLLLQMEEQNPQRPSVIVHKTFLSLKSLLGFRNCVNKTEPIELENEDILKHARQIKNVTESVFEELDAFTAFLCET